MRRHFLVRATQPCLDGIPSLAMPNQIVVAGALISDSALLVAQRARPTQLAGLWSYPAARCRRGRATTPRWPANCSRNSESRSRSGPLGWDVALDERTTLRAYLVTQTGGVLHPNDHRALRWVTADELDVAAVGAYRSGVVG